jgi:tetratricopeptide (TPR) repeat protein
VAYVAACAFSPLEQLPRRTVSVIALLGLALGLAKQAYFLLPLIFLLIPVRKLGTPVRYTLALVMVMAASLLPVLAWSAVVRSVYSPPEVGPGFRIDPAEQFQRMMTGKDDPGALLLHTAQRWQSYGEEYLGFLGRLDARLPNWVYIVQLGLLLIVCAVDSDSAPRLAGRQAALAGGIFLVVGVVVLFILHLTWDRIGSPFIVFQGRYFIPSAPLLALVLSYPSSLLPRVRRAVFRFVPVLTLVTVPAILAAALWQVHQRYYVDSDFARAERCYKRGRELLNAKDPVEQAQGYDLLEEAVRIDPDHPGANFLLGISLKRTRPREAVDHLRAAMRRGRAFVPTLTELGALLANNFEFDEAISLYEEASRLRPNDTNIAQALATIRLNRKNVADAPIKFERAMQSRLDATTTEKRYVGTAREGIYLKPNRDRVASDVGLGLPGPCYWRCPPPSGRDIGPLTVGDKAPAEQREPFYACSELIGTKRIFIFPPPQGAMLLADEDVSWFFQQPMTRLSDEELQREEVYRKEQRIEFPLAKLP